MSEVVTLVTLREALEIVRHLTPEESRALAIATDSPMLQTACVWRADMSKKGCNAFNALLLAAKAGPLTAHGLKRRAILDALRTGPQTDDTLRPFAGTPKVAIATLRRQGYPIITQYRRGRVEYYLDAPDRAA